MVDAEGGETGYTWTPTGQPFAQRQPNGVVTHYAYDARDRVTEIRIGSNLPLPLGLLSYTYDLAGNRTGATEYLGGETHTLAWRYDAADRLTAETRRDIDGLALVDSTYQYDATGNRTAHTQGGMRTAYTYDALDQLLTASSAAGTTGFTYDARGNRTGAAVQFLGGASSSTAYAYDALNRLVGVSGSDAPGASYAYDSANRRVTSTTSYPAAPSQTVQFIWDEFSAYGDIVAELDGAGQLQAAYTLGATGVAAQTAAGRTAYYAQDALGSTRALVDGAGALTDTFRYDAYGSLYSADPFADTSSPAAAFLFTGHRYDAETGLYQARARFYDPAMGRFLTRDTWPVDYTNPAS
jgi:RHS repeat-associated protein